MDVTKSKIEKALTIEHPFLSQITDYLILSSFPKDKYSEYILSSGIRMIVSMTIPRAPSVYRRPPMQFVHCPSLDTPLTPIPIFILRRGVSAALPFIDGGKSVLVHCKSGVHRSVAMVCCILIARGYTADNAMRLVKEKRDKADPYVPYIRKRIEKFESYWRKHHGETNTGGY